jgi:TetR/AcrR family transcriptional repressor of nem operon
VNQYPSAEAFTWNRQLLAEASGVIDRVVQNGYAGVMARPREFDAEEALDQVMRVFWDQGYQASTLADLTKAADVRKQSLYSVFGDKRSLFLKSLTLYRHQILSSARKVLGAADSPLEGIARLMRYAARPLGPKDGPSGCLMANTALELGLRDSDVAAELKRMFRAMEEMLTAAVKQGQQRGEITTRFDSAAIGQSLANTINGLRILQSTGATSQQLKTVVELALAAIRA